MKFPKFAKGFANTTSRFKRAKSDSPSKALSCRLTELPHELTVQILDELDNASLCALGSTCKELNKLIFPYFFSKNNVQNPLDGWIARYRAPQHTLRAIRCCLSTKNLGDIFFYFNEGIENLVEEVEEMHAIVKRTKRVTHLELDLSDPDYWAQKHMWDVHERDPPQMQLMEQDWAKMYLRLLTAALTKGCKTAHLSGGNTFLKYLRHQGGTADEDGPSTLPVQSSSGRRTEATYYFDPRYKGQIVQSVGRWESVSSSKRQADHQPTTPVLNDRRKRSRPQLLWKWNLGTPTPKLTTLRLHSDVFLASPSFFDWMVQVLSWSAPTLSHFDLHCPETSSENWVPLSLIVRLPSLTQFYITSDLARSSDHHQGTDILSFLSLHPRIQKLSLRGIQISTSLEDTWMSTPKPVLPHLVEVAINPIYIPWLLPDAKRCPRLTEVTLLIEHYADQNRPFSYHLLDKTLEKLLLRSHKLNLLGFRNHTDDHAELFSWFQSHVDAGPGASIVSRFVGTKFLLIDAERYVKVVDSPPLRTLIARFFGLFPSVESVELRNCCGIPLQNNLEDHIPPLVELLRLHCPGIKKLKIDSEPPIDMLTFGQEKS